MPSQLHETLLAIFRNQPGLAPKLFRDALNVDMPEHTQARIDSADLTDIQPAEYRADLVLILQEKAPVLGIIVEVQLSTDERKLYAWPAYVANLRARLKCPVCLLVVTTDAGVARWAEKPIELGGGNRFTPLVLNLSAVPEILDETQARADPELAVLSAMAHGRDDDHRKAARIARAAHLACVALDDERSRLYCDLIIASLSEAALLEQDMNPFKYEYQSDFAKRYVAEGRVEGRVEGRAEIILRLLALRFGPVPSEIEARIRQASITELDLIGEHLLTAPTLQQTLERARQAAEAS
jgi:Domain of unknown function (DUF4351)